MHIYIFLFLIGAFLGWLACEFADRWGCSQRYQSALPKKLFILFVSGIAAAWLYWWEVQMGMLLPAGTKDFFFTDAQRYGILLILFTFLLAATLTDFYEMIIPDSITIIGTFTALLATLLFPYAALLEQSPWRAEHATPIHVWSPNPQSLLFLTGDYPLLVITLLWWFWCFAMLDRVWYTKLPFHKANAIFWRYLYRSPRTKYIAATAVIVPIGFTFARDILLMVEPFTTLIGCPPDYEINRVLLSALVGMATGMILVWGIRLVARYVLGIEAMGFGDVTLMGMIGAFLGWQAVLLVFFAAPFFGLVYGIVNLALGKGRAVPYGPFLCLATVVVVIAWSPIWGATAEYFSFGIEIIGLALLGLLVLFGGLLHVVHKIMSGRSRS
jgi:prepilin signal peptidase PulO-like enzyme (type II secretory pathway)